MKESWRNKDLQDGLGAYDSPMDLEKAWKDLEARRKPKKNKHRLFFLWFLGLVGLLSVGSYWLLQNDGSGLDHVSLTNDRQEEEKLSKASSEKETPIVSDMEGSSIKGEKYESKTIRDSNHKNIKANERMNSNSMVRDEQATLDLFQEKPNNNIIASKEGKLKTKPKLQNGSILKAVNPNVSTDSERQFQKTSALSIPESRVVDKLSLLTLKATLLDERNIVPLNLPFKRNGLESVEKGDKIRLKNNQEEVRSNIGMSSTYGFRTSGFVQQEEQPLDAMMFTAFYDRFISKRIYLKAGVSFQQFTTELNGKEINEWRAIEDDLLLFENHHTDGSSSLVYGSGEVSYRETNTHQIFNRYRFISIPLVAGYEMPLSGRSSLCIETGLAVAIVTAHSGKVWQDGSIVPFAESSTLETKNMGVLQSVSSFYYQVKVGHQLSLFLGGQANFHLNNRVNLEEEDRQGFRSFGLILGGKLSL